MSKSVSCHRLSLSTRDAEALLLVVATGLLSEGLLAWTASLTGSKLRGGGGPMVCAGGAAACCGSAGLLAGLRGALLLAV